MQGCSAKDKQLTDEQLQVAFKLDSGLSGGTYGGELWVPAPYGPVAYSGTYTLEARAYYIDDYGRQVAFNAKWIPEDSNVAVVSPEEGTQVSITIQGVGETRMLVKTSKGLSKSFHIKATAKNDPIQIIEILQ